MLKEPQKKNISLISKSENNKQSTSVEKKSEKLSKAVLSKELINDLRELINQTRDNVACSVNFSIIIL